MKEREAVLDGTQATADAIAIGKVDGPAFSIVRGVMPNGCPVCGSVGVFLVDAPQERWGRCFKCLHFWPR